MFKKFNIKPKSAQIILENDDLSQEKDQQNSLKPIGVTKEIKKSKKGVSAIEIAQIREDGEEFNYSNRRGGDINNMSGLIDRKYQRENKDNDEQREIDEFIKKKLQQSGMSNLDNNIENYNSHGGKNFKEVQKEVEIKEDEKNEQKKQAVLNKNKNEIDELDKLAIMQQQSNPESKGVGLSWTTGIIEVKLSKEKKAQNIQQYEQQRRSKLLGDDIGQVYNNGIVKDALNKKPQMTKQKIQRQENERQYKEYKQFEQRFLKQGKAYKIDAIKRNQYKENIEEQNN